MAFSPDGASVAALSTGQSVFVFSASTGESDWQADLGGAIGVAWSPDSSYVAVAHQGGVAVLNRVDGTPAPLRPITASAASSVAYSRDGTKIIAGGIDGTVSAFNTDTATKQWSRPVGDFMVLVAVSADQHWVAALSLDKRLAVYDVARGTPRYSSPVACDQLADYPIRLQYSPTLRHILVMDFTTTLVIDAPTGAVVHSCPGPSCLIPPDGSAVAAANVAVDAVERYDLGIKILSYPVITPRLGQIAMSPRTTSKPMVAFSDAGNPATTPPTSPAVTVIKATRDTVAPERRVFLPGTIISIAFLDDGQTIAAANPTTVVVQPILLTAGWTKPLSQVSTIARAGAHGEWIAVATGRTAQLYSSTPTNTGDPTPRWSSPPTYQQNITHIASSSDGTRIVTGSQDRSTRVLEAETGIMIFAIPQQTGVIQSIVFQPNASVLGASYENGAVFLVDTKQPPIQPSPALKQPVPCRQLAFSFDGTLLAVAVDAHAPVNNPTVDIYDVRDIDSPRGPLQQLVFSVPVTTLAFSADNNLAVATDTTLVQIYDPRTGVELTRLVHPKNVKRFAFSSDGALIATACDDNTVRVWVT
jgi:WD40 repeat protein